MLDIQPHGNIGTESVITIRSFLLHHLIMACDMLISQPHQIITRVQTLAFQLDTDKVLSTPLLQFFTSAAFTAWKNQFLNQHSLVVESIHRNTQRTKSIR